ncbi:MAG: dUTP diphosphatase [Actinomycetota bacterium]
MLELLIQRVSPAVDLPRFAHVGDAGLDLQSAVDATLKPGDRQSIPTGIALAIPEGYAGLVLPRSGLAVKHGLGLVNSPGLIDSGYRGELKIVLINHDLNDPVEIRSGDRIAQLLIVEVPQIHVIETKDLPGTNRGANGFGSTGR